MKLLKRIFLISFLLILLIYVTNITSLPNSVILFHGEKLDITTVFGVNIEKENTYEAIQTSGKVNNENILQKTIANVNLFNIFNIKEIEVNTIPRTTVIPLGNSIGLKLYTNGVLVVGLSEINGQKPYSNSRNRRRRCYC